MNPVNQSGNKPKYYTASAGTVLWDGPDIECLSICKGDSILDVQYKAAKLICFLKEELDLSDLDLKNIFSDCAQCPDPEKKLQTVLQGLIDRVDELLKKASATSKTAAEKRIFLASCLREQDADGNMPSDLPHSEYTSLIGRKVCTVLNDMAGIKSRLDSVEGDVDDLKARVDTLEQTDDALDLIKNRVTKLEQGAEILSNVLGTSTELAAILSSEAEGNGPNGEVLALGGDGSILYAGNSQDVAESLKRLWAVAADLRTAVKLIQDNCCQIECDDIVIDFDIKLLENRTQARLFFVAKSHLPAGFKDVKPTGNILTISDAAGHTHQVPIKIWEAVTEVDGITIDLADTALDPTLDYFFSMDAAVRSEKLTCVKCITKTAAYVGGATCDYCEVTAIAGGADTAGQAIIIYELPNETILG